MASAVEVFEALKQRQTAFKLAFGSPAGEAILEDLAEFCRARTTTFHADPRIHAALEGRREVYLRIMEHLDLTAAQLYEMKTGRQLNPRDFADKETEE